MHFAGFGMPPITGPIGPPPIGLLATQLAGMRATVRRAGQLANLLDSSKRQSLLQPVVKSLAANLIRKLETKRIPAKQQAQTTTVVTEEHTPLLQLAAHSHVFGGEPHVHVNSDPHVHLIEDAFYDFAPLHGLSSSDLFGDSLHILDQPLTNIILPQPQNQYHVDILHPQIIPQSIVQPQLIQPILQPHYVQPQIIHQPHYIDRPVVKEVIKEVIKPVIKEVVKQPTIIKQIVQRPAPVQQVTKQVILPQPQVTRQVPWQQHITRQVPVQQHITRQVPVQQLRQVQQSILPHQQKKIWNVKGGKK